MADPGFSPGGAPTPKIAIIFNIFAENCMKMKEFGPPGGGARPWRPPLDPPMVRNVGDIGDRTPVLHEQENNSKRKSYTVFLFFEQIFILNLSKK